MPPSASSPEGVRTRRQTFQACGPQTLRPNHGCGTRASGQRLTPRSRPGARFQGRGGHELRSHIRLPLLSQHLRGHQGLRPSSGRRSCQLGPAGCCSVENRHSHLPCFCPRLAGGRPQWGREGLGEGEAGRVVSQYPECAGSRPGHTPPAGFPQVLSGPVRTLICGRSRWRGSPGWLLD